MPIKEAVRRRVWHALSPHTAEAAGVSLATLQQFITGSASLSEQQIGDLARYFGMRETA